ncbi:MAG: lytic transglycosylase domain-containing protein [Pseudomonadota bacterium]
MTHSFAVPARAVFVSVVLMLGSVGHAAQPERLAAALQAVAAGDFDQARAQAAATRDQIAVDLVDWHRLRAGRGTWNDYASFLTRNADWPGLPLMRKRAEAQLPANLPAAQIKAFFVQTKPQTARGAILYTATLNRADAQAARAQVWTTQVLSREGRAQMLQRFGPELAAHHEARLDMLLWEGKTEAAEELLPQIGAAPAALARARIALQEKRNGVDAAIKAIPRSHAGDGGLAHDRFRWRLDKGLRPQAEELLLQRSVSVEALGRPEAWASTRRALARQAMRDGRIQTAYRLASQHFLTSGSHYADLEWLSGYLALRGLNDPSRALAHFDRFRKAVETPISLGRAGYWIGRAFEARGDTDAARKAYAYGGVFQTSFYGQLAAERAGVAPDHSIARNPGLPAYRNSSFARSTPVQAARQLHAAGNSVLALRFLLHVQESLGHKESAALAHLAMDLGQTAAAVKISKRLVRGGVIHPEIYYPVTSLAQEARVVAPELAMAIARQESELNPRAISPAGARGLMQLMPRTAQKVSGQLGLEYSAARLTRDPSYNARLGTQYLADMLDRYGGSVLLASAAYNAGPGRVDAWLARYGDPRRADVDTIRWIEHIPFRETRNYVMRVMESQHVYRARISGQAGPFRLSAALGISQ